MPETDRIGTEEENFSLHCIQDSQKYVKQNPETFQETPVKCNNGLEASGGEHQFVEWPKESRESNPLFFQIRKVLPLILSSTNKMIG